MIRDYLRAHPEEAQKYAEHKQKTVQKGVNTLLAYSDEKAAFMQNLLERAKEYNRR